MRLLMITRKIDERDASPAGFTYGWARKLEMKLEKLYVIAWQKSDRGSLPQNIKIISLPDNKFFKVLFLQYYLLVFLPKVDGIFCHQNPEYTILSAPLAKIFRKKIISWHTHKAVNWKLHMVNFFADKILTASEQSCRLKNRNKIIATGHGIDVDYFKPSEQEFNNKKFRIISIGRISPAKDYEMLINAVKLLKENIELKIIGQPSLKSDKKYFKKLKQLATGLDVEFTGGVPYNKILSYYQNCDLFINLSQTGSVDKAVLEAMACGVLVLTSNEAFKGILNDDRLILDSGSFQDLSRKIIGLIKLPAGVKNGISKKLREIVVKDHNLDNLVLKIVKNFKE